MTMSITDLPGVSAPTPEPAASLPHPHGAHDDAPEMVIRPRKGWIGIDWKELWRFRELMFFLVWRDVKVRYKQAALGFAWAIFVPLIMVTIYTLIFGRAGGMRGYIPDNLPYPLFIFAGVIPWMMISSGISAGGMSLVSQQNLLNKIYLPRLFIPMAIVGGGLVDMAISFTVFSFMMLIYGIVPQWTIVYVPLLILLTMMTALGFALSLSALTVTYRDVRFMIPFMVQILMLLSAVAFPSTVLRNYPWLRFGNPIAGVLDAFRAAIFREWPLHVGHTVYSVLFIMALFVWGLFYFRKTERRFADIT
ncbi:MAG TPA: ABC transporter permease [Tepidisphaeraceae bacterium]|nr:ABC transporter permease [Tepidisphaeraceae bacterium]